MINIDLNKAEESLKTIIKKIRESKSKVITVDPITGTFMKDGFVAKGMQTYDNDRVQHKQKFAAFDLGFCVIYIEPSLYENIIIFEDGTKEEIKFNEDFL